MSLRSRLVERPEARPLVELLVRGSAVHCPCCGSSFRRFRDFSGSNRMCWRCESLERHRSLTLLFAQRPELFTPGMSILHVAPEPALRLAFERVPAVRYVSGDLTAEFGPEEIDVTDLSQFDDASFDAVVCNHVLEHVSDDQRAMRELRRVLKPGGWGVLLVPDVRDPTTDEDPSLGDPEERLARFGQRDHVRRYGWDYVDRLATAGFKVTVEDPAARFSDAEIERARLRKLGELEPLFLVGA
jgi:SAM-dependent methyltransferase